MSDLYNAAQVKVSQKKSENKKISPQQFTLQDEQAQIQCFGFGRYYSSINLELLQKRNIYLISTVHL